MKITAKWLAGITFIVIFGGIGITTLLGWWQTESTKVPEKYVEVEYAEEYNPADIRGSYSFGDVSRIFEIPLEDLKVAFALPFDDISGLGLNQLEGLFEEAANNGMEIGTSSVQLFTAYYKGLPFDAMDEYLPAPALDILLANTTLSDEQMAYLETHLVDIEVLGNPENTEDQINEEESTSEGSEPTSNASAEEEHSETEDYTVKGNTTFREVMDWGVPQETIETIIGGSMPNALFTIKDFCLENGLSFGEIKESIQAEVPAQ
jgi:hypothetical protein